MNLKRLPMTAYAGFILLILIIAVSGCSTAQVKQPEPSPAQTQAAPETVQPVISGLQADSVVAALGTTQVTCTATGSGADNLTYNWTATGGKIEGAGSTVSWTAPELSGAYMIMVVVSDSRGGAAKKSVVITVPEKPNHPPVIDGIVYARPKRQPITIKPNMTDEEKRKIPTLVTIRGDNPELSCIAHDEDNDPLTFIWRTTGGKIYGTGANVQWIAPFEASKYTISVEVTDGKSAPDVFQITVDVHCCSG